MKNIIKHIGLFLIIITVILHSCKKDKTTPPILSTTEPTDITQTSVTSGGNTTSDGGEELIIAGICWSTSTNPTVKDKHTSDAKEPGNFTSKLTGLTPDTKYYIRAYAANKTDIGYGNEVTFTTIPIALASLSTANIDSITSATALCGGNITFDGGGVITERGICWAIHQNPTTDNDKTLDGTGIGSFTSDIKCLSFATTYYVRAYAINSAGTAYGNQLSFSTPGTNPIIFNPDLTYGSVTDIEGNCYKTIQISNRIWMAENLKTTHYNDGTRILDYYWYNNDPSTIKDTYGALYKVAAVVTDKLCPVEWHVPSVSEWKELTAYLGGDDIAGGKLREAGTTHWDSPNNGATNESGFTALPGGLHGDNYPEFTGLNSSGLWWSRTPLRASAAEYQYFNLWLGYNNANSYPEGRNFPYKALSVRCLQNYGPTLITDSANYNIVIKPGGYYLITAESGGHDIDGKGSAITHKGLCWNWVGRPEISYCVGFTDEGSGSGSFKSTIKVSSFEPQSLHIRAYATNSNGTAYGNEILLPMQ